MRRSPLLVIFITVFIDLVGFGIVIPVLPFYVEGTKFNASPRMVGLLFASYSVMQLIFTPVLGRLSDRRARPRQRDAALLRPAGDGDAGSPGARLRGDGALVAAPQGDAQLTARLRPRRLLPLRRRLLDHDLLVRPLHALPLRLRRARHGLDFRLRRRRRRDCPGDRKSVV